MKRFPIKIAGLFIGIGLIFFAFMNLISASLYRWLSGSRGIDLHALETYEFPFVMHKYGGNATIDQFVWSGVVANLSSLRF